ncbi:MAG TPA: hypothetical protein VNJ01_12830 [Bacteriovoracaceae bacterium]|nr:hypothetical protein [Bacteriovoracaceae bacterium]
MKLALIGYPVEHSLSPALYRSLLGAELETYDLLPFKDSAAIPELAEFGRRYDGINITAPYKTHFFRQVEVESALVRKIGAINTISFQGPVVQGTNTDLLAVNEILLRQRRQFKKLNLIVLGGGVMSSVTTLIAEQLALPVKVLSRNAVDDLSTIDLRLHRRAGHQNLIINACSRDYVFRGELDSDDIFWDYNYSISAHEASLPKLVKSYQDGRELLELQAFHAVQFWNANKV